MDLEVGCVRPRFGSDVYECVGQPSPESLPSSLQTGHDSEQPNPSQLENCDSGSNTFPILFKRNEKLSKPDSIKNRAISSRFTFGRVLELGVIDHPLIIESFQYLDAVIC